MLIANSFVFKEPVFNYSGEFPFLWDEIKVPIQFGSNYKIAMEVFKKAGFDIVNDFPEKSKEQWTSLQKKYLLEEAQTEPMETLTVNNNWVEFTLRYVVIYNQRRATKSALFLKILEAVAEYRGLIKFASATFQLVGAPDFNVNIKTPKDV